MPSGAPANTKPKRWSPWVEASPAVGSVPSADPQEALVPAAFMPFARDGEEMTRTLCTGLNDQETRRDLAVAGRRTILGRHTCSHRVRRGPALPPAGRVGGDAVRGA